MAGQDTIAIVPAVLRQRLSARLRSIYLGRGEQLGGDGAVAGSFPAMNQFECVAVHLGAIMGESDKIRGQTADDVEDGSIAWSFFPNLL